MQHELLPNETVLCIFIIMLAQDFLTTFSIQYHASVVVTLVTPLHAGPVPLRRTDRMHFGLVSIDEQMNLFPPTVRLSAR